MTVKNKIPSAKEIEDIRSEYRRLIADFFALNGSGAYDAVIKNLMEELDKIEWLSERTKEKK